MNFLLNPSQLLSLSFVLHSLRHTTHFSSDFMPKLFASTLQPCLLQTPLSPLGISCTQSKTILGNFPKLGTISRWVAIKKMHISSPPVSTIFIFLNPLDPVLLHRFFFVLWNANETEQMCYMVRRGYALSHRKTCNGWEPTVLLNTTLGIWEYGSFRLRGLENCMELKELL